MSAHVQLPSMNVIKQILKIGCLAMQISKDTENNGHSK